MDIKSAEMCLKNEKKWKKVDNIKKIIYKQKNVDASTSTKKAKNRVDARTPTNKHYPNVTDCAHVCQVFLRISLKIKERKKCVHMN